MKKLLSVALIFTLVLSMTVMSAFPTTATTVDVKEISKNAYNSLENALSELEITPAVKPEIATTSARTFSVSKEAGISFDEVDGYVYGYVGDSDDDGFVSVMDATAIQLHLAQTQIISAVSCKMSDVDMDNQATIMDATAIQLHLASIQEYEYINHVLYSPYDDFNPLLDTFDDIAQYIKENGFAGEDENSYYMFNYEEYENDNVYYSLDYYEDYDVISVYTSTYIAENDAYIDTTMNITRGNMIFDYYSDMYSDSDIFYKWTGFGEIVDITDDFETTTDLVCEEFETAYNIPESDITESLSLMPLTNIVVIDSFVCYDVPCSAFDLVYDVQSLIK
ncbi:MAG: hypothetical protein IJ015_05340 [Ruminococcus sp.]|nr:hypothetical protein [Ruminococcus sp.]